LWINYNTILSGITHEYRFGDMERLTNCEQAAYNAIRQAASENRPASDWDIYLAMGSRARNPGDEAAQQAAKVIICRLRRKLGSDDEIVTVSGIGYYSKSATG